jgi:Zn-dependent protease with chaperone function
MLLLVCLPLGAPLLAAPAARLLADRLPPRTATWVLAGSAVALAAASCGVLGLITFAAAMRLPAIDALGGMSLLAVDRGDQASLPLGIITGALLFWAAGAAARASWLRAAALVSAHRRSRRLPPAARLAGPDGALVIADDSVDAYTVPGWPSRIVVTSGLLDLLSPAEREVVLAHERAHVHGRHYLFTAAVRLAAAANPLLLPLTSALGYSIERWADERAAAAAGSRPLAAQTIAKTALAASADVARRPIWAAVLGIVPRPALRRGTGLVPRRVAALLVPPPKRGVLLAALAVALVAVSCLSALEAARDLHALIEFAQAAAS